MDSGVNRTTQRQAYFDCLKVSAIFAVIILHVAGQNWHTADIYSTEWQTFHFINSMARWGVPIFVMISGALFLGKDIPVRKLYTKYIRRLVFSYVIWSTAYALMESPDIGTGLSLFISGHYHMWFIPMMIGLYMSVPILRPLTNDLKKIRYFLILSLVFTFIIPELLRLAQDFGNDLVIYETAAVSTLYENMHMDIFVGFPSYFLLGYYMYYFDLTGKQRCLIYALGAAGFILTVCLGMAATYKSGIPCNSYFSNFTVNVLMMSVAVFTFFKYSAFFTDHAGRKITKLSKYTFGVYLTHPMIIELLDKRFGLNSMSFSPVLSVISISAAVSAAAFLISALLNQIPVIHKYLV